MRLVSEVWRADDSFIIFGFNMPSRHVRNKETGEAAGADSELYLQVVGYKG